MAESTEQILLQRGDQGYSGPSVSGAGSKTSPALGDAVATILAAALGDGAYEVLVNVGFGATVAAGDANNFALKHGSTVVAAVIAANPVASTMGPVIRFPRVEIEDAEDLVVYAPAGGVTNSIYRAQVVATPLAS